MSGVRSTGRCPAWPEDSGLLLGAVGDSLLVLGVVAGSGPGLAEQDMAWTGLRMLAWPGLGVVAWPKVGSVDCFKD